MMNAMHNDKPAQMYARRPLNYDDVEVILMGRIAGPDIKKRWYGSISLADRFLTNELTRDQVQQSFQYLKKYLVRAYRSTRVRCVDGRCIEGYDANRAIMKDRDLGPQLAGGTAGAAVCLRLARGPENDTYTKTSFEEDLMNFATEIKSMGFELGGHRDDNATAHNTGCGAIDKMPEIIAIMTATANATRLKELTRSVLGPMYDAKIYSEILGNAVLLQSESDGYFRDYKQTIFAKIQQQSKNAISKLVGSHNEVAAIVNRVHGYTWHRDEFSADNNHKIQAFNYDFWDSIELTESLMKSDSYMAGLSDHRRMIEARKILTARVMYTVATLMALTDGSIDLYVIDEKDEAGKIIDLFDGFGTRVGSAPLAVR